MGSSQWEGLLSFLLFHECRSGVGAPSERMGVENLFNAECYYHFQDKAMLSWDCPKLIPPVANRTRSPLFLFIEGWSQLPNRSGPNHILSPWGCLGVFHLPWSPLFTPIRVFDISPFPANLLPQGLRSAKAPGSIMNVLDHLQLLSL